MLSIQRGKHSIPWWLCLLDHGWPRMATVSGYKYQYTLSKLGVSPLRAGTSFLGPLALDGAVRVSLDLALGRAARLMELSSRSPSPSLARAAGPTAHAQASPKLLSKQQNSSRPRPLAGAGQAPGPPLRLAGGRTNRRGAPGEGRGRAASRAPGYRGSCSRECAARADRLP